MFAKLKKKIQEEAQNVVGSPEGDRWSGGKPTSPAAPGLASPVSKDYPGGPIFGHIRKDSSDMSSKMGSRASSVDDIAKESSSKEEILAMLMKRTDQVKKMETKISELAAMLKDKNRKIEKLENNLTKQEDAALEQLEEIKEKYYAEKAKVSVGFKEAVDKKEDELRLKVQKELQTLEKKNTELEERLTKAEEYREKYFKTEEENDELQGLTTQELAKVKHMLMIAEDELREQDENIAASDRKVLDLENEIKSLLQQITVLNSNCEEAEDTNRTLTNSWEEARRSTDKITQQLKEQHSEYEKSQKHSSELQSAHNNLKSENQQLEREQGAKVEKIDHLQERIQTLTQRLQEGDLSVDERVCSLESERDALEDKLTDVRTQLAELKTTSSENIAKLQQQVSDLQCRVKESSEDAERCRKELHDVQNNLQKEVESWKSKLQMALVEVKEKDRLLETTKDTHKAELTRQKKNSSSQEEDLRDQLRQLKLQLDSSERVRDRERTGAQEKIKLTEGPCTLNLLAKMGKKLVRNTIEKMKEIIAIRGLESLGDVILDDDDLNPGDHIAVERTYRGADIQHHGIIVQGKMAWKVIHFAPEDVTKSHLHRLSVGVIRRDDLSTFAIDKNYVRVNYEKDEELPVKEVLKTAERYLNNQEFGEYHGLNNNCEHFAAFCKSGKRTSRQTKLMELVKLAAQSVISEEKWKDRDNNVMDFLESSSPLTKFAIITIMFAILMYFIWNKLVSMW